MSFEPLPFAVSSQSDGCAVPPLSFVTVFTSFRWAAWSLLLIVHTAESPSASEIELPLTGWPWFLTQLQAPAVYPGRFVSESVYVPAETSDSAPPAPESGVGPAAESVKSVGTALPPLSLVTGFTSFRCAAWSPFTIVHVFDCPSAIVPAQPAEALSCAYPAGPLSVASSEPSGVRG